MSDLNKLFKIVLPNLEFEKDVNLFFNKKKEFLFENNIEKEYDIRSTDTWMNMFPVAKYSKYCYIQNLYLNICLSSNAKIQILDIKYSLAFSRHSEVIATINIEANKVISFEIKNFQNYENLYVKIFSQNKEFEIKEFFWGTKTKPKEQNNIAIVSCTYKREQFVQRNIELFNNFILSNPDLKDRISMFVVDNGKTLDKNLENENIKIIPNINAGGAGGFTRGIIEAEKSNKNYTRVLLMDDDVLVFTESFYRTLILSDYLKDEYKNSFIHGAMLSLYKKNLFFESNAIQTKKWVDSLYKENNISLVENITKINYAPDDLYKDINKKVSSAWWYCCFPLKFIKEKGLPMPVFFRCDDIEWSWRNFGEYHIAMNGICVWHSPFEWRVSKPVEWYFSRRNWHFINIIHTPNYKKIFLKDLKHKFDYLIKTYDYTSCIISIQMMSDLLKCDKSFRENPQNLMNRIFTLTQEDIYEPILEINKADVLKKELAILKVNLKKIKNKHKFRKYLYKFTLKGKLIPKFLWKNCRLCSALYMDKTYFYFAKQVNVYNLLTNKYEIRVQNDKKEKELKKEFDKIFAKLDKNYNSIKENLSKAAQEFKTEDFWNNYLGINKKN